MDRNCHVKYHFGMFVTIDMAGRLVVPKALREQFNLTPGCQIQIEASSNGITLRRADEGSALVRKQGILVHHGSIRTSVDIREFVRAERKAHNAHIARGIG